MDFIEPKAQNELKSILSDSVSGSAQLLENINAYIIEHVTDKVELKIVIDLLEKQFPLFTTIQKHLSTLRAMVQTSSIEEIIQFLKTFKIENEKKFISIYLNAKPILSKLEKIICISNSRTLQKLFKMLREDKPGLKIVVLESQPGGEGKILAKSLKETGIPVKFIKDSKMKEYVQIIDAAIIGCDAISEGGDAINKIGSKQLALECKLADKPVYVVGDKSKIVSQERFNNFLKFDLQIPNRNLFEVIEKDLITKIITD
ncbi:MAG: hypothetical protein KJ666_18305 [Bacteroidetes bacterium]|nr:hypothetical protein [Bacteroidota bacterium]